MTTTATIGGASGTTTEHRYRLPGIVREGIAQLSILETALWPLQAGTLISPKFETSYAFTRRNERERQIATVTVRSSLGLRPSDEYVLWGLLGATLSHPNPDPLLLATPYWMLKRLGLAVGGSQYGELRNSLLRLATTSYQNTAFYNPETQEHEYAAFQFLSILLPTVGGVGETVDNERCWRIEWNSVFLRFCRATGGNLLFDLDLYRQLTPPSRRLFLKLKDRFWRSKRVYLNVDDLTVNGLGFSPGRPLKKRKYDLVRCLRELLAHQVISLGRGQTDPQELFFKHAKGLYVVAFYEGAYFRQPLAERTTRQKNAIFDDPLFEPLQKIGVDAAAIERIFRKHPRGLIQRWVKITDAAMHEKPRGFPGFKVSPAAFLIDGIEHQRLPPDWMHAHEKRRERRQWEQEHAAVTAPEQKLRHEYEAHRAAALKQFLLSPAGHEQYERVLAIYRDLYQRTDPGRFREAAHEAAITRMEKDYIRFPEYGVWAVERSEEGSELTA